MEEMQPPPSQEGIPCQGQGERLETVLRGSLEFSCSLRAGAAEPLSMSPEGQMCQQRQEELEAMCTQLQRQIGEMEVREAAARRLPLRNRVRARLSGPLATHPTPGPCSGFPTQD